MTIISDDDVKANISTNLKQLMVAKKISQRELSRRTGDAVTTLNGIIRGTTMPGSGLIARLAQALHVAPSRIIFVAKKKSRKRA
jgi:transcriptional regulator with XRE-family HTH domain